MKNSVCWALIPFIFILDRITKILVMARWPEGGGVALVPGVLHLTRVNNTGAAFGLWKNAALVLTGISIVSVVLILWYMRKLLSQVPVRGSVYGWALVAGGALGNLYDRIRFGYVIDCIDLRVWPVFNIADSSICLGVFLILWQLLRKKNIPGRA